MAVSIRLKIVALPCSARSIGKQKVLSVHNKGFNTMRILPKLSDTLAVVPVTQQR